MDIKILDSWLREYLDTKATHTKIADYLSLCGPSVERIKDFGRDKIYEIEVTTNRIDSASVYGIAREAAAILPRFDISAKLKPIKNNLNNVFKPKVGYLKADVDGSLCPRFMACLIKNVKYGQSPEYIKLRLESAGVRSLNNIVDISNYIMLELGQPVHTFDYDKIKNSKMILRESRKGEKITTLDNKQFTLPGGDIVIEDGSGKLIDLAGVMGGNLSAVDENTVNVLLFVQTYNPVNIRKTSMSLAQRTMAATIFEKGTDPELTKPAILKAIKMFSELTKGVAENEILDIYKNQVKLQTISLQYDFIIKRLGIPLSKDQITSYLKALQFSVNWHNQTLSVVVPSFRALDVRSQEDILEEVARVYGYHNLPSQLMAGVLPGRSTAKIFTFEENIKNLLSGWGGNEVYTLSLVPQEFVDKSSLKIRNPLGRDTEYLRTSLMPSLKNAATWNRGTVEVFHIFEMANVYIPINKNLPKEVLMLAGIFEGFSYRDAKGITEALLEKLNIDYEIAVSENKNYSPGKCIEFKSGGLFLGNLGYIEGTNNIFYEFILQNLYEATPKSLTYKEISKYPAQVEDITLVIPNLVYAGEIAKIINKEENIVNSELIGTYGQDTLTFRIRYQDTNKTLTDTEVEKIRTKLINKLTAKFGVRVK